MLSTLKSKSASQDIFKLKVYIILAFCLLNYSFVKSHTTIPISDINFEQALVDLNIDSNGVNGNILKHDAESVINLFIGNKNISDLTGIEAFINLKYIYAYGNNISVVNFNNNPHLELINLEDNNVTTINVKTNSNLKEIYISGNELNTIDVSDNLLLTVLSCNVNSLENLDVSTNTNLINLQCYDNNLSTLNLKSNLDLEALFCSGNSLNTLDISSNLNLKTLVCDNNNLENISLESNLSLEYLSCSNNALLSLDISNNVNLNRILCNNNNLTEIDVTSISNLFLFYVQNNQLSSLDLSNNPSLKYFRSENNNLNSIDVRNTSNQIINEFVATQNSGLSCVFVDDINADYLNDWQFDSAINFVASEEDCQLLTVDNTAVVIDSISVYPNPAIKKNVNINLSTDLAQLKMFSTTGQLILNKSLNSGINNINLESVSSGMYMLSIYSEGKTTNKKLVIN